MERLFGRIDSGNIARPPAIMLTSGKDPKRVRADGLVPGPGCAQGWAAGADISTGRRISARRCLDAQGTTHQATPIMRQPRLPQQHRVSGNSPAR
ncbi:hypothetical protein [Paracraurococcus ruber]|uniref:hypothetical protein n=1 Tax=Paracraurococcus ruber TaxID=77675 RepID=UPI001057F9AA|nr:hypothetical protein [Paracraurococcus ruber]TDG33937.1 hypothetical protein E2C05_01465 [Paracraurococcus ruber]